MEHPEGGQAVIPGTGDPGPSVLRAPCERIRQVRVDLEHKVGSLSVVPVRSATAGSRPGTSQEINEAQILAAPRVTPIG
jgi:hypothetical protein